MLGLKVKVKPSTDIILCDKSDNQDVWTVFRDKVIHDGRTYAQSSMPETEWLLLVDEVTESEKNDKTSIGYYANGHLGYDKTFIKSALELWETTTRSIDGITNDGGNYSFYLDWKNLCLLDDNGNVTITFLALMRFACNLVKNFMNNDNIDREKSVFLEKTFNILQENTDRLSDSFRSGKKLDLNWVKEFKLDNILKNSVYFYICESINPNEIPNALNLLKNLHGLARFPIIPFFYLTSIDQEPKEHLAFPTCDSHEFPVIVKLGRQNHLNTDSIEIQSSAVVMCLLTLRPPSCMPQASNTSSNDNSTHNKSELGRVDWERFFLGYEGEELSGTTWDRLFWIDTFFNRLAQPIVDQGFYGYLVKPFLERKAGDTKIDLFGHEASSQIASARRLIPSMQKFGGLGSIITGSLTYAELFSTKRSKRYLDKWVLNQRDSVNEWLVTCAETAWKITVSRETRDLKEDNDIKKLIEFFKKVHPYCIIHSIQSPSLLMINCDIKLGSTQTQSDLGNKLISYHPPSGSSFSQNELAEEFPWNLTRWVLAALSNAFKL